MTCLSWMSEISSYLQYLISSISYLALSFLIYLHPAEQQAKPGRSLLHVHHPRHLWHLGHAGCRHLCKGHFLFVYRFVKISLPRFWYKHLRRTTFRLGLASTSTLELFMVVVTCLACRSLDTFCSTTVTFFLKGFSSCLSHRMVPGLNLCSSSVYWLLLAVQSWWVDRIIPVFKPMENVGLSSYIWNQMGHSHI